MIDNSHISSYRWIEAAEKAAVNHNSSNSNNSSYSSKSLPRDAKRKEPLGQANSSTYESIRQKNGWVFGGEKEILKGWNGNFEMGEFLGVKRKGVEWKFQKEMKRKFQGLERKFKKKIDVEKV